MASRVSILIAAYNAEAFIADTLRSALAQTWPQTEIIVVDDGSRDRTLQQARQYASSRVQVLSCAHRGASAARNTALRHAQGDYIQWLDADDLLAPDKIAQQLRYASVGERVLLSSAFGEFYVEPQRARFRADALWQDLSPVEFLLTRFLHNVWMHPGAWLVSRRLSELAGPWDERLSLDDDGEYFARVVAASERVCFVPQARAYYRRGNPRSLSRSVSDTACRSLALSLGLCIGHLRALEDSERTRRAGLQILATWLDYFYPEKTELLQEIYRLAAELGGTLPPPVLSWKYAPLKTVFGWQTAKHLRTLIANLKLRALIRREQLSLALTRKA